MEEGCSAAPAAQPRGRWEGDSALSGLPQERGRRLLTGRWGVSLATSSSSALPQGLPHLGPWRGAGLCPQALLCQLQMPEQPESWCSPSSASQGLSKEPPCSPCLPVTARSGGARQQEEVPGLGTSPWTEVGAVTRRRGRSVLGRSPGQSLPAGLKERNLEPLPPATGHPAQALRTELCQGGLLV